MGYARIVSGGTDGRYTIEVDYGSGTKAAVLAALGAHLANVDAQILTTQAKVTEADASEQSQLDSLAALQEAYIAQAASGVVGDPQGLKPAITGTMKLLQVLRARHTPLRLKLKALQHERVIIVGRVIYWTAFDPLQTKQAWCTDFTENGAGDFAATIDIPGEPSLQLLAPGCRVWGPGDGIMQAREMCSPEQAFLNAALLPGWQKFKPTYRWGTCTAIDYYANTMSVSLSSALSSAQRLPVNQASTLTGVPVVYMSCNAGAFEVEDRVVVQFIGQNWSSPRVVGFLDNPKPCDFVCVYAQSPGYFFQCSQAALFAQIMARSVTMEARINGADWVPGESFATADPIGEFWGWPFIDDIDVIYGSVSRHILAAYPAGGLAGNPSLPDLIYASVFPTRTVLPGGAVVNTDNVVEFRIRTSARTVFNVAVKGPDDFRLKTRGGINLVGGSEAVDILDYTLTG
jgi:hypothetical protein